MADRRVPQAIEDFLRQPWAHHVTMTVLREGEVVGPLAAIDALRPDQAEALGRYVAESGGV